MRESAALRWYHLSLIFWKGSLVIGAPITVKGTATGSRRNTSAASTSIPEAHDDSRGWGGSISCGYALLCLLTQKTSRTVRTLLCTSPSSPPSIQRSQVTRTASATAARPETPPISAYTRSASRQGRVQQCCHRSGDQLATSRTSSSICL